MRTRSPLYSVFAVVLFAIVTLSACSKTPEQISGSDLLAILDEGSYSLVVYNNDSVSTYSARGVQDLLYLTAEEPERLHGAVVADKMIGKAAAALMVIGGVKEVNTHLICTPARELLESAGICLDAEEEIPMIMNRNKTGQCPIDSQLNDAQTAEECVDILRNLTF